MKKKNLKFLIPITITIVLLTIIKIAEPEEVDWTKSFSRKDKIPFGGYVIYDLAQSLFPDKSCSKELSIYNILKDNYYSSVRMFHKRLLFSDSDTEYLLDYVAKATTFYFSIWNFGDLADSLRIKTYDMFLRRIR
jgi:hypothetical protein